MTAKTAAYLTKRIAHLEAVKDIVSDKFEVAPVSFCVRRTDVAAEVARALGVVLSPQVIRDVYLVAPKMGFAPVKNGQRRLYVGCKYRDEDPILALERSRKNRHDVRREKE